MDLVLFISRLLQQPGIDDCGAPRSAGSWQGSCLHAHSSLASLPRAARTTMRTAPSSAALQLLVPLMIDLAPWVHVNNLQAPHAAATGAGAGRSGGTGPTAAAGAVVACLEQGGVGRVWVAYAECEERAGRLSTCCTSIEGRNGPCLFHTACANAVQHTAGQTRAPRCPTSSTR